MARTALGLVGRDPARALALADAAVAAGRMTQQREAVAVAHRAAGWALRQLNDPRHAEQRLRTAVSSATAAGAVRTAAESRLTLALVLVDQGRSQPALHQLRLASAVLTGEALVAVDSQRAVVHYRRGELHLARRIMDDVIPAVRRSGDRLQLARSLNNRALISADRRDFATAAADLHEAQALYVELGMDMLAAEVEGNLALVCLRTGDLPSALLHYRTAETRLAEFGRPSGHLVAGRGDALRLAGLLTESRHALDEAIVTLDRTGQRALLAEVILARAETSLLAGDFEPAAADARSAVSEFRRQSRPGWTRMAELVAIRIADATGNPDGSLVRRALRCATRLSEAGWPAGESDARLIAARAAIAAGKIEVADRELSRLSTPRRFDPIEQRIRLAAARATWHDLHGRRRLAYSALRSGLRLMEGHHALLGATDLRTHAAALGSQLARTGVGWAISSGDARTVLYWSEQFRARSLGLQTVRPGRDSQLSAALDDVRKHSTIAPGQPISRYKLWQAERRAMEIARMAPAAVFSPPPVAGYRAVAAALGPVTLVEFVEHDQQLFAVTLAGDSCRLHRLGPLGQVTSRISVILFGLRRLAGGFGSVRSLATTMQTVRTAATEVDQILLGRVLRGQAVDELLIVPTGILHSLPWAALPSLSAATFRLTPSAGFSLRGTAGAGSGQVVLVQGPGLDPSTEIGRLARLYPEATVLTGANADTATVLRTLGSSEIAHIAAHGHARAENPMFSAIMMNDGPLTLYDLDDLPSMPRLVILPVCQSAASSVLPGDELIGLVGILLSRGARTVVAALTPVSDRAVAAMMERLHEYLLAGMTPAAALLSAKKHLDETHPAEFAAAASFLCFGD